MAGPGRPADKKRLLYRDRMQDMSERSFTRYYTALQRVKQIGDSLNDPEWATETLEHAWANSRHRDGTLNACKFERTCKKHIIRKINALIGVTAIDTNGHDLRLHRLK